MEPSSFRYVGVTQIGAEAPVAVLEGAFPMPMRVREGDAVAGYRVAEITGERLVLQRGGTTQTLALGGDRKDWRVIPLSDAPPIRLSDPRNAPLRPLPLHVLSRLTDVMPQAGELQRVRTDTEDGVPVYRIERRIDGRRWEIRIDQAAQVRRIEEDLSLAILPARVADAANREVPGYRINPQDTPKRIDRAGQRYYEVEIRQEGGRDEIDLRIAPDGRVLGRG